MITFAYTVAQAEHLTILDEHRNLAVMLITLEDEPVVHLMVADIIERLGHPHEFDTARFFDQNIRRFADWVEGTCESGIALDHLFAEVRDEISRHPDDSLTWTPLRAGISAEPAQEARQLLKAFTGASVPFRPLKPLRPEQS